MGNKLNGLILIIIGVFIFIFIHPIGGVIIAVIGIGALVGGTDLKKYGDVWVGDPNKKSLWTAGFTSLFVPGWGQVYNGEGFFKGWLYLLATIGGFILFVIPGIIILFYGIHQASKTAEKMNSGEIPFKQTSTLMFWLYPIITICAVLLGITYVLPIFSHG